MKLAVASTLDGLPWGASEELWSQAAVRLLGRGHEVVVRTAAPPTPPDGLAAVVAAGGRLERRPPPPIGPVQAAARLVRRLVADPVLAWLRRERPDLVLVNVAYHAEDVTSAAAAVRLGLRHAVLVHCASAGDWVHAARLPELRRAYLDAAACFFVSDENRRIVERQVAAPLPHARVIDNPLRARPREPQPWPDAPPWRLAVVGRVHFRSKGHDLLLEALARGAWRDRPVEVLIVGEDQGNLRQLHDLVARLDLGGVVRVVGPVADPTALWRSAHALVLPSRYEGMPIVTAEAQWCGRVPVVTAVGRNPDLVADGRTGFLAAAPTVELVAAALERAWDRREEWPVIGARAARAVRAAYEPDPVGRFVEELEELGGAPTGSTGKAAA